MQSARRGAYQIASKVCVTVPRSISPEDRTPRIRELCARAAATEDPDEATKIASQLRTELHAQIAYLRVMVGMYRSRASSDDDSNESECA
jgi:hypothetical protein